MYKIAFTDIDGTLLGPNRDLTPATISAVTQLKGKIPFILVSSRMPRQMYHLQEDLEILDLPLIAYNGGYISHNKKGLFSVEIPTAIVEKIVQYNQRDRQERVHLSLFHADQWYVEEMDYWALREQTNTKASPRIKSNKEVIELWKKEAVGAHKIMCMGEKEKIDQLWSYLEDEFSDQLHLYRSKDTYIEIANKKISKLTGIQEILNQCFPQIKLSEAVAFGDNYNDIEMLEGVGLGVAVANAREEVKAVADQITKNHKEDGVAISLKNIFNTSLRNNSQE
jgi:Cof subfamily protein (haloacid dehalogenase superfamily)